MQLVRVGDRSSLEKTFECHAEMNDWLAAVKLDQVRYEVNWWRKDRNNTAQYCFPEVDGLDTPRPSRHTDSQKKNQYLSEVSYKPKDCRWLSRQINGMNKYD